MAGAKLVAEKVHRFGPEMRLSEAIVSALEWRASETSTA